METAQVDDEAWYAAKAAMLQLLLCALAEDVATRESRLAESMMGLLQEDVQAIGNVLAVTLRYLAHSMEVAFRSAQGAREAVADELAPLVEHGGE